jgi:REP element-mobilizing transposase RayT
MTRPLRIQYPGACYYVTAQGNNKGMLFETKEDRERFLSYLKVAHERFGAIFHAYCLMDDHYHLLLETPNANLSRICHLINGSYTIYFNLKTGRSGHLFQGRYKAILVEKDAYGQKLSRFIHLNPLRAGLVRELARYEWSSYPAYIGVTEKPAWLHVNYLLGFFNQETGTAQENYRTFIQSRDDFSARRMMKAIVGSAFLGSTEFIDRIKDRWIDEKNADVQNVSVIRAIEKRITLEGVKNTVKYVAGIKSTYYKGLCLYISQQYGGFSLNEIGNYYGMKPPAVSQYNRRFKIRIIQDQNLRNMLGRVVEEVKSQISRPDPAERR